MPSHRIERTTEDIRRELTAIFRELKDPRFRSAPSRGLIAPRRRSRDSSPLAASSAASWVTASDCAMFPS